VDKKSKVCLVSCSVLKEELKQLIKQGSLAAELVFVSKYFHVDYATVEKNLRRVLEQYTTKF
jgi:gluconate kinase